MRDQAPCHAPYRPPYDADFGLTTGRPAVDIMCGHCLMKMCAIQL